MAKKCSSIADLSEEKIARLIAESGIRLRFDKVARRLLDDVKASVAQVLPADQSIAFTVTAPIRLPAKTSAALQESLHRLATRRLSMTINGNSVRARLIKKRGNRMPRVIGFVHDPESNPDIALDLAEAYLREH